MGSTEYLALDGLLPLSLSQREVWLDQRAWPDSPHLTLGGAIFFEGPLDLPRLQQSLWRLVAEQQALRLAPLAEGGQRLLDRHRPVLAQHWTEASEDLRSAAARLWQAQTRLPFALDGQPPWRIVLLSHPAQQHAVLLQFHHLVMDGWGTMQLMHSWAACHAALDSAPPLAAAPSYLAVLQASLRYQASPDFAADAAFWQRQLPDLPPPLLERHYPASKADALPAAHTAVLTLTRADYRRIGQFAAAQGLSEFVVILTVLAAYFAHVRQRDTVLIGVPCLNRSGHAQRATLGMFVGVLPLRLQLAACASMASLMAEVGRSLRQALRHGHYPLSETSRHLHTLRQNRDSLFDVLLSYERQDYAVAFDAAHSVGSRQFFTGIARYPLGITVCEFAQDQDVEWVLEGSSLYFNAGELDLLGRRLLHLLNQALAEPERPLARLDPLPAEERWALLHGRYRDLPQHADPQPFIRLFEHQARLYPEACALVWDGGSLDYAGLELAAERLAGQLRQLGARREQIVALCMRRSPEAVIAILAIAKAGAAFLPLDTDTPDARLAAILADSRCLAVLADAGQLARLKPLHRSVHATGALLEAPPARTAPASPIAAADLAYVLYTSGSTGQPKGVMVEHGSLARRLAWLARSYAITRQDRAGQATQLTFDPALVELLLPLVHGASVALPPAGRLAPEAVADFALRHGVSIMAFVPATLQRFLDAAGGSPRLQLRVACCGGEVLAPELAARFLAETRARLFNVYGPTEACIFATAWECERRSPEVGLPVGRPVDDTRIYVLDRQLQLLPFACAGDIYIGGPTLARGYLHRPDLDAASFLADPFLPGERLYRTGDRGWLSSDGDLHFLGRSDRQVKLRGYRIELAEIEQVLLGAPGVSQAVCQLDQSGAKPQLRAWAAAHGQDKHSLQRHLRQRLPDYMLPGQLTVLAALPLNASGKVDLAALLQLAPAQATARPRQPASALERELLGLWQAALRRDDIGLDDSFFELGGDSLAAIDILAGIDRLAGRHSSLLMLTEHPSVAEMARALLDELSPQRLLLPLNPPCLGPTVYLAASGHGDLLRFQQLARTLEHRCHLLMLQPPSQGGFARIEELAELYAERIVAYASGPCSLAGFSVGGISALETARCLQARGIAVRQLLLIDSVYPRSLLRRPRFWRLLGWLARHLYVQELSMNGRRLGAMFADAGLLAQIMALGGYRPRPLAGPVRLIQSSGLRNWEGALFRPWQTLFGPQLRCRVVAGLHGSMFEAGNVQALADALLAELDGEAGQADG